jgi:hypothetical protein
MISGGWCANLVCMSDELAKEIRRFNVLMEDQSSKLNAVLEMVGAQPTLDDFHRLECKVDNLGDRMDVVEAAVKDTSADVAELRRQSGFARPGHIIRRVG